MREGFVTYRGFIEAIDIIPDAEEKWELFKAVARYALDGIEPELPWYLQSIFISFKPQIDANNKRYENGKKGGAPVGNSNAKKSENNQKQPKTTKNNQKQPKDKVKDKDKDKVKDKDILCSPAVNDEQETENVFNQLWKLYPHKKGKSQVSKKSKKAISEIGIEEMTRAINRYVKDLEKESEWRHPQNGSTFFNSGYVDYLDENYEELPEQPPKQEQSQKQDWKNKFVNFPQRTWDFEEIERVEQERRDRKREGTH